MGKDVNGWQLSPVLDDYFGNDYLFRAAIGFQAMFANTPIEAYYPGVFKDTDGKTLDGSSGKYTMTFAKGKTPPVGAFWSTTMYDAKKRLMTENAINRYKIGSADNLKADADGSTTCSGSEHVRGQSKNSVYGTETIILNCYSDPEYSEFYYTAQLVVKETKVELK